MACVLLFTRRFQGANHPQLHRDSHRAGAEPPSPQQGPETVWSCAAAAQGMVRPPTCSPGPKHCRPRGGSRWPRSCVPVENPGVGYCTLLQTSCQHGALHKHLQALTCSSHQQPQRWRVWGFFALPHIPHGVESKAGCALEQGWGILCPCPALFSPDDPSSYSHIMF